MNIAVDVIAAFNPLGEIKPIYIRLEDEYHKLISYKLDVKYVKEEKYSGIRSILFSCSYIKYDDTVEDITIRFYMESHKWIIVNDSKA
jgi:hypothetical protein